MPTLGVESMFLLGMSQILTTLIQYKIEPLYELFKLQSMISESIRKSNKNKSQQTNTAFVIFLLRM